MTVAQRSHGVHLPSALVAFAGALLLLGLTGGTLRAWTAHGPVLVPALRYWLLAAGAALTLGILLNKGLRGLRSDLTGWLAGLWLVFLTDWLDRSYSLFSAPAIRGEILIGAALMFLLIRTNAFGWYRVLLVASSLLLFRSLLAETGGSLIIADDHGPVLYRLQLLKENFPFIPSYNTQWNAGSDARDFFATGILNFYLLFAPLIHLFELTDIYTLLVGAVLFMILPAAIFAAAREQQLPTAAASIAALMALAATLLWYRWGFSYGAMGFIVAAALFPWNVSFAATILSSEQPLSARKAAAGVATLSLMLCWSLTAVAFLPLLLWGLVLLRRVLRKRYVKSVVAALLIINLPWMIIFVSVSQVARFTSLTAPTGAGRIESVEPGAAAEQSEAQSSVVAGSAEAITAKAVRGDSRRLSVKAVIHHLREFTTKSNPLLLFLGLPGILFLRRRSDRLACGALAVWLTILGIVAAPLKPQLELERMLILLLLLLAVPAAAAVWKLVTLPSLCRRKLAAAAVSLVGGFVFAGVFAAGSVVHNRTLTRYTLADKSVLKLVDLIRAHGGDGRSVFSGFVLHELNGGHVAPLAHMSKRPLVASSPIHNLWWYADLIPASFRERGDAGIEEYLDLMNATSVLAHEAKWLEYFTRHPERYRLVGSAGKFSFYTREADGRGYFQEGSGAVLAQDTGSLTVRIDSAPAVLRYTYFSFLESTSCSLDRRTYGGSVDLLVVRDCPPGSVVTIRAVDAFTRVAGEIGR